MVNDDTPPELNPSTDGVPEWLLVNITKIKTALQTNYTAIGEVKTDVSDVKKGQSELRSQLARTDQKIESHQQYHRDNPGKANRNIKPANNPGGVTYKWIADWGMKAVFILLGGAATVGFKLAYDFIADILAK